MQNLPVPYHSQWDPDANASRDECGPTCLSMIFDFYGKPATANAIFSKTGAGVDSLISVAQLLLAAQAMGFTANYKTELTVKDLTNYLDNSIPVIALVNNGSLGSRQDKSDTGGHFLVVVGYRDDGYFVNDPDFWGQFRPDGDHHFYTKAEFETAWSSCHLDGNPDNTLLIIDPLPKGTFVDDATFTKLVQKSTAADNIGKFLNYEQDVIDSPQFSQLVIDKISQLNTMAFGNKSTISTPTPPAVPTGTPPAPVTEPSPTPDSSPNQAVPTAKISIWGEIANLFKEFFNIKVVSK